MTLSLIAVVIGATLAGVVVHIIWWRIQRPVDDALSLAVIVGVGPLLLSVAATLSRPTLACAPEFSLQYLILLGALALLHGLFALVYMSCYTAAQAASPTVLIVLSAANTRGGITREELESRLTDDLVCGDLIGAAIDEKFVELKNGQLTIGHRGRGLLAMGRRVRRLAGLAKPVG